MTFLRIEGVNFAHCIEDTNDLSTRRGGGLMLLDAVNDISTRFEGKLKAISTGASMGLFEVTDATLAEKVATDVRKYLSDHALFKFGTFVVDVAKDEFPAGAERALAANRWRQMGTLSFSSIGLTASTSGACAVDEVRPGSERMTIKAEPNQPVSASVYARRKDGIGKKQVFYGTHLEGDKGSNCLQSLTYTYDFEELAKELPSDIKPETLEGKIAVFYADGNKFSRFNRNAKSTATLSEWDTYIKRQRKVLLAKLVQTASESPRWQRNGAIRLETLLWGGDEMIFVVPGWCGMQLAELFFQQTKSMQYPTDTGAPLTHAAGLVLCHHQAPIGPMTRLAMALGDSVKTPDNESQVNAMGWMVLESFDHAGGDPDGYLKRRFRHGAVDLKQLSLDPEAIEAMTTKLPTLKDNLPRSTIVRVVRMMAEGVAFNGKNGEPVTLVANSYRQIDSAMQSSRKFGDWISLWKQLHSSRDGGDWNADPTHISPSDLPAWVKLLELWDYCVASEPAAVSKDAAKGAAR